MQLFEFLETFYKHLKKELKKGKSIVLLGDYNIAHREIDIHDPVRNKAGALPGSPDSGRFRSYGSATADGQRTT